MPTAVALVHDYLTQRGGAERVVLSMARAFPDAPLHTSLYDPDQTFPDFAGQEVHTLSLDRIAALHRHHRWGLPLLAPAFSRLRVEADVVVCSSSGWAHGVRTPGRKIVYCYSPARWLYQPERYLRASSSSARAAQNIMAPALRRWDQRAARSAHRYLTSSRAVRRQIEQVYGIDAAVVPPPITFSAEGRWRPVPGVEPGYVLCVGRLLPYKNVDAVLGAFALGRLKGHQLVVVGAGPDRARLTGLASGNSRILPGVDDEQLRWLYAHASGVVAASYEDFGLTPLEAAAFAKPAAVLRWGGFLDTVVEGSTGVFFEEPRAELIAAAVTELLARRWDASTLVHHASRFSETTFHGRLRSIVAEEAAA